MHKQYYEVLDLLSEQLKRCFNQPNMIHLEQIETILLNSACGKKLTTEELIKLHTLPKIFWNKTMKTLHLLFALKLLLLKLRTK